MRFFTADDTRQMITARGTTIGPLLHQMMEDSIVANKQRQLPLHQIWKLRLKKGEAVRASFIDYPINAAGLPSLGDYPLLYEAKRHYLPPELAQRLRMSTGYHICRTDPALLTNPALSMREAMCVLCANAVVVNAPPTRYLFSLLAIWDLGPIMEPFSEIHKDLDTLSRVEIIPWGLPRKNFWPTLRGVEHLGEDFLIKKKWHWSDRGPPSPHRTFQEIVDRASRGNPNYIGVLGRILDQIKIVKRELGPDLIKLFGWT
jgi:hypothetical protein